MGGKGTSLRQYLLTRLLLVIPMVFILLTLVFLLMRVAPGDPISASLGGRVPQEEVERIKEELGYDRPLYVQYAEYLGDVVRGDFGTAITDSRPIGDIIRENGAATLELTFFAMIVAIVVGVTFGLLAGRYRDTWIDGGGRLFGILIYAMPVFFLGLMAQLFFGSYLGWLPTSGRASPLTDATIETHTNIYTIDTLIERDWDAFVDVVKHLILPAVTLGLVTAGVFIRLIRVNVIRTMKDDYIEAARARGIDERSVVYHHAFRNAARPRDHGRGPDGRAPALGRGSDRDDVQLARNRQDADLLPREPRLPRRAGDHHRLRPRRGRRERRHRLRQRVHRPEDPGTDGGSRAGRAGSTASAATGRSAQGVRGRSPRRAG